MEHFYNLYKGRTIDKNELNHVNKEVLTYMIQNIHTMAQTNVMMQRQNEMTPASYSSIPTPPIPENNREELYKQQFMQKQQEYKSLFDTINKNLDNRVSQKRRGLGDFPEIGGADESELGLLPKNNESIHLGDEHNTMKTDLKEFLRGIGLKSKSNTDSADPEYLPVSIENTNHLGT